MEKEYIKVGEYYVSNLILSEEQKKPIGKYGMMKLNYLKNHRKAKYNMMKVNGTLFSYLHEVNEQAARMVETTVAQMAKADGTDEALKAKDQMKWVGLMNNYKYCAKEIVLRELIFT